MVLTSLQICDVLSISIWESEPKGVLVQKQLPTALHDSVLTFLMGRLGPDRVMQDENAARRSDSHERASFV